MRRNGTVIAMSVTLMMSLTGCVIPPQSLDMSAPSVAEVRQAVCPHPMTRAERNRVADALDALPRGEPLNVVAARIATADEAASICRGR